MSVRLILQCRQAMGLFGFVPLPFLPMHPQLLYPLSCGRTLLPFLRRLESRWRIWSG